MRPEELAQRLREPESAGTTQVRLKASPRRLRSVTVCSHARVHCAQVVDVRDSDYGGGCVAGSWNEPSEQWSDDAFVAQLAQRLAQAQRTSVVLHCMYSQQRGPACAARLASVAKDGLDE